MKIEQYLSRERKEMPEWLKNFKDGDSIDSRDFFSSGVLYYPGCGDDRQPIETFIRAHCRHCYVYADYGHSEAEFIERLGSFDGYNLISVIKLSEKDVVPSWKTHYTFSEEEKKAVISNPIPVQKSFGMYLVFERRPECDDSAGCERFVLLYLCADGIAAYDAIFANGYCRDFDLVVQDHGFGGNYSSFGNDGIMHRIAEKSGIFPRLILCGDNSKIWDGYRDAGLEPVTGGMHNNERILYIRQDV